RSCEPPRNSPFWHSELSSRFLACLTLQIAQDNDGTILVGQAAQLFVQQRLKIMPLVLFCLGWFGHLRHLSFAFLLFGGGRPRLQRRLVSLPIQPVGE